MKRADKAGTGRRIAPVWGVLFVAVLDGQVSCTRIRKGIQVSGDYTMIPLRGLRADFGVYREEIVGL